MERPDGWRLVALRDIAEIVGGITKGQKRQGGKALRHVPYLRVANVQRGFLDLSEVKEIEASEQEIAALLLRPGDILFNEGGDRDKLGRGWVWSGEIPHCIHQNHVFRARLRDSDDEPKFISYYANSVGQKYFYAEGKHTTNLASINLTKLGALPIPLPPPAVQRAIVSEIEKQLTRLNTGVASVHRVQANLKRLRTAVLKAACEGRLVPTEAEVARREGRSYETGGELLERLLSERQVGWSGRGKYTKPIEPPNSSLAALPDGWTWGTVDQILRAQLCNGVSVKGTDHLPGVRALRLSAMSNSGFDYDDVRYLPLENSDVEDLFIVAGDFFVSRGNGSLHLVGRGTSAQLPPEPTIFPDTMIRLRFVSTAQQTRWLPTIWASPILRRQIEGKVKTTAGIYKISQPQLATIVIPLPPLDEQTRIVAEVERRVSVLQELETAMSLNLQRATRLRQSVLQRAFSGALVSQGRDLSCQGDVVRRPSAEGLR